MDEALGVLGMLFVVVIIIVIVVTIDSLEVFHVNTFRNGIVTISKNEIYECKLTKESQKIMELERKIKNLKKK